MRAELTLFGKVLRGLRRRAKLTQQELADASGLTRTTVYRLELGLRPPFEDTVRRLARGLGIPVEELKPDVKFGTLDPSDPRVVLGPGEALREIRRASGKTLAEAAEAAGVSTATLSRFERNARPTFSMTAGTPVWADNPRGVRIVAERLAKLLAFDDADQLERRLRAAHQAETRSSSGSTRGQGRLVRVGLGKSARPVLRAVTARVLSTRTGGLTIPTTTEPPTRLRRCGGSVDAFPVRHAVRSGGERTDQVPKPAHGGCFEGIDRKTALLPFGEQAGLRQDRKVRRAAVLG